MTKVDKMIEIVKEAYIAVYGESKWNKLSDQQKHDAVMLIVKDALGRIESKH